jgi:hypothetical protein
VGFISGARVCHTDHGSADTPDVGEVSDFDLEDSSLSWRHGPHLASVHDFWIVIEISNNVAGASPVTLRVVCDHVRGAHVSFVSYQNLVFCLYFCSCSVDVGLGYYLVA